MIKKLTVFTLSLALLLTGCQQQNLSPKDTLSAISKKMMEQNNFSQVAEGVMNVVPEDSDNNAITRLGMLKNLKFNYTAKIEAIKSDSPKFSIHGTFSANGLSMNLGMYADTEEFVLNYPIIGKLIVVKIDELFDNYEQQTGETADKDIIQKVIKDTREIYCPLIIDACLKNIKDEDIELIDKHTFTHHEEKVTSKAINISLSKESYIALTKGFITAIKDDEKVYNAIKAYNIPDFPETYEAYRETFNVDGEDISTALEKSFNEMDVVFDNMSYNIILGYDSSYLINYAQVNMQLNVPKSKENDVPKIDMNYDITLKFDYKDVKVERPETNDENSIGLQDLGMIY